MSNVCIQIMKGAVRFMVWVSLNWLQRLSEFSTSMQGVNTGKS